MPWKRTGGASAERASDDVFAGGAVGRHVAKVYMAVQGASETVEGEAARKKQNNKLDEKGTRGRIKKKQTHII